MLIAELKPLSIMGVSNSEMFLSDQKDTMELSFLVRPPLELQRGCQIAPDSPDEGKDELVMMGPSMESSKSQSSGELLKVDDDHEDEDNDGFKTPTCLDHKIPVFLKCPPAPKKPKSVPIIISPKRKAFRRRRILLDLTKEIESLFPPALLADLGNKIKKVRQGTDFK